MSLEHSRPPRRFWAEASATAVHILNRAPTFTLLGLTPLEALTGTKPSCAHLPVFGCEAYVHVPKEQRSKLDRKSIPHLRVFGCQAYVHVPKEQRSKLDRKSIPHVFLGYSSVSKAYRLWDPAAAAGKLTISRDVIFDERSTSSSDATLLPLPSTTPPIVPSSSSSQPSTSAAPVAPPSTWAPLKPLGSEADSSDSFADEDSLVTRRVPRWLYQTVKILASLPCPLHLLPVVLVDRLVFDRLLRITILLILL